MVGLDKTALKVMPMVGSDLHAAAMDELIVSKGGAVRY